MRARRRLALRLAAPALVVAVLLAGTAARAADELPSCGDQQRFRPGRSPYPCDAGRRWLWLLGPFAGYSFGQGSRAHTGLELSLVTARRRDDGAHTNYAGLVWGGLVDVGYVSGPHAFRGSVEAQVAGCSSLCGGTSFGPTLTVDDARARGGARLTLWFGLGLLLYGRFGADFPWSPYGEVGVFVKIPLSKL